MAQRKSETRNKPSVQELAELLTSIKDPEMMLGFLEGVMTSEELRDISSRIEAARLLSTNRPEDTDAEPSDGPGITA